jgi:hypothetical protein
VGDSSFYIFFVIWLLNSCCYVRVVKSVQYVFTYLNGIWMVLCWLSILTSLMWYLTMVGSTIPDDNLLCLGGFLFKISFFDVVENVLLTCLPKFFFYGNEYLMWPSSFNDYNLHEQCIWEFIRWPYSRILLRCSPFLSLFTPYVMCCTLFSSSVIEDWWCTVHEAQNLPHYCYVCLV